MSKSLSKEFYFSEDIKKSADRLMDFLYLKETLNKYGRVIVTGSYNTDLMTNYDLDLDVISKDKRKSAVAFLNEIIESKKIQKVQFGDFENFPRENRPKDCIVVLIVIFEDSKWEIEVWFKDVQDLAKNILEEKLKQLSSEIRSEILKEKINRDINSDKHTLPSHSIYTKYI
jgi:hypothetical protein